ncbi:MAG: DNA cytosine methyltransferase [Bacteroidia bacterium]|jgi:DNA (cytosine-5)-methyltransferase 1|nr:DNA cytosine methyltransferase [Bacteroidia bacterium]
MKKFFTRIFEGPGKLLEKINNRFGTFFTGGGGSAIGLTLAGLRSVFGADMDKHSERCYRENFGGEFFSEPIDQDTGKRIIDKCEEAYQMQYLQLSPPCQPYSMLTRPGSHRPEDVKAFLDAIKCIHDLDPNIVDIENTLALTFIHNRSFMDAIDEELCKLNNYHIVRKNLLCSDYGVPQNRIRTIWRLVHKRLNHQPVFPVPTHTNKSMLTMNNVMKEPPIAIYSQQWGKKPISGNEICPTITATHDLIFLGEGGIRYTPDIEDIKRLCSFPETYQLAGDPAIEYYKHWERLGNAVPPLLQKALADSAITQILFPYYNINLN